MDSATLIRTTRERVHLTQGELAARAGTSQPAISRYESGTSSPAVDTLDRILAAMGSRLELSAVDAPGHLDVRGTRMRKLRLFREQIRRTARAHGASNLSVFGSVARGDDGPQSDIDILVDLDVRTHGLLPLAELQDDLERLLGESIDVVARGALAAHVAERALAEAVPL